MAADKKTRNVKREHRCPRCERMFTAFGLRGHAIACKGREAGAAESAPRTPAAPASAPPAKTGDDGWGVLGKW